MAKKLLNPLEDPLSASSSDDVDMETLSGEDEEQISDSFSEEDEPKIPAKIPSTKTLTTPSAAPAKPDSGFKKDSDSESEPAQKPIAVTSKKEGNDLPAVNSGKKRPSEATTSKDMHVNRTKKVSGDDEKMSGDENKKPIFKRVWSLEDEISLLQGMIDFKAETGTNPYDDINGFYDLAKKCISFNASKIQFGHKIMSLKKKYMGKDRKKGKLSSHDKKCSGLVKYIWGSDGVTGSNILRATGEFKKLSL